MAFPLLTATSAARLESPEIAIRNLIENSENPSMWGMAAAATVGPLGLNALGRFTGCSVNSNGAKWGRVNALSEAVDIGSSYVISFYIRPDMSNELRLVVWYPGSSAGDSIAGAIGTLPAPESDFNLLQSTLQSDGQTYLVRHEYTASRSGIADIGIGPNTNVSGHGIIILAAQIEFGSQPPSYQKIPL